MVAASAEKLDLGWADQGVRLQELKNFKGSKIIIECNTFWVLWLSNAEFLEGGQGLVATCTEELDYCWAEQDLRSQELNNAKGSRPESSLDS